MFFFVIFYFNQVTFVDYGNMDWVAFDKLYIIPNAYLSLPFVSLECRLANLLPTEFADSAENMYKNVYWILMI